MLFSILFWSMPQVFMQCNDPSVALLTCCFWRIKSAVRKYRWLTSQSHLISQRSRLWLVPLIPTKCHEKCIHFITISPCSVSNLCIFWNWIEFCYFWLKWSCCIYGDTFIFVNVVCIWRPRRFAILVRAASPDNKLVEQRIAGHESMPQVW